MEQSVLAKLRRRSRWALSSLLMVAYPGIVIASVMGLAGDARGAFYPLLLLAYVFYVGSLAYPLVWLGSLLVAAGTRLFAVEDSRAEKIRNVCSVVPLAYAAAGLILMTGVSVLSGILG